MPDAGDEEEEDQAERLDLVRQILAKAEDWGISPDFTPMEHQMRGIAWMLGREDSAYAGGILGDDMGLVRSEQLHRHPPDDSY